MKIQCAKKEHAGMLSELIYSTEEDPELIWGYGSKEEVIKRLSKLIKRTDTRYSYKYARVATLGGQVCGAMIALPHNKLASLDDYTGKIIFDLQQGIWKKVRWFFTTLKETDTKESESGEYYIANLATFRWARGKGIATKLMQDAEERARIFGLNKCSLLVDQEKPAVVRLYSGLGYKIKEEIIDQQKYYRMIKPLKVA